MSCGTYQTCNAVFILKFDATPQYRAEGDPVHVSLHIFELANWLSTVSTMTFPPVVIGRVGQRVIPGTTVQTSNDGPHRYGAGFTYWFVQNTEWDGTLDWDGLDVSKLEVTDPILLTVTVSAGAASVMRAVPLFATPGKNLGKPACGAGNPCDIATGNKYQEETDFSGGELIPGFTRHYNHMGGTDAGLGVGWTSDYHQKLRSNGDKLTVVRADGRRERLTKSGTTWLPDADSRLKVVSGGSGFTLTVDTGTVETYSTLGKLLSITDRAGLTQTLIYSDGSAGPNGGYVVDTLGNPTAAVLPAGLLLRVTGASGRRLSFSYDANNRIALMIDPAGNRYIYGYDANNNLISVTYPDTTPTNISDNPKRQYLYNEAGLTPGDLPHALTGIIDENNGRFATWNYNAQGKAASSEHAGGAEHVTLNYGNGSTLVTDALGTARTYTFQSILGMLKNTGISGQPCNGCTATTTYDANGNPATRTDFNGVKTTYIYDLTRNLETSRTEAFATPQARTITTQWDTTFRLPKLITEPGRTTTYSYDPVSGNLLSKTLTDTVTLATRTWTYTYTSATDGTLPNLLKTVNGPRTDVTDITTYSYKPNGDLATVTNALGHLTTITSVDAHGRPFTILDPNGLTTTLSYFPRGWLKSKTIGTETTTYSYDNVGQLKQVTLPTASTLRYTYDAAHRLTDITDPTNNRLHYTLDAMGNRTKEEIITPTGGILYSHTRIFNALNQLYQDIGAVNQTSTYTYDNNGNLKTEDGPRTDVVDLTKNQYDALNRLINVTAADTGVTQYAYDPLDQLKTVTDPKLLATSYTVNALGDTSKTESPDSGLTTATYDTAGNLKTETDARSFTTTYTYDALNRIRRKQSSDTNTPIFTYFYDGFCGKGRLCRIARNGAAHLYFGYDAMGRVNSQTSATTDGTWMETYTTYNAAGQLTSVLYPGDRTVNYGYDSQGRINQISTLDPSGTVTTVLASAIQYYPFGAVRSFTYGNGVGYRVNRDRDYRPATASNGDTFTLLGYDPAGNVAALYEASNGQTFSYDAVNRLKSASSDVLNAYGNLAYSYDTNGNRTQETRNGTLTPYVYNPAGSNWLAQIGSDSRTKDAAGNTATSTSFGTLGYDGYRRMIKSTKQNAVYEYNALGQRIKKSVSSGNTYFHYGQSGELLYEIDSLGKNKHYIYLNGMLIARIDNGVPYYYHTDHLGTPQAMTDAAQAIVWNAKVEPFGKVLIKNQTVVNNVRLPGQYADQETGLHYNYYRSTYDPGTGRYGEADPIGLRGGLNLYAYVGGNPISYTDPSGLVSDKIDGNRTQIHKTDTDKNWPSDPHGHIYDKNQVVDVDGKVYNKTTKQEVGKLSKRGMEKWLKLLKKAGHGVKCLAPALFVYDWATEGFSPAVDGALWPLSETWSD